MIEALFTIVVTLVVLGILVPLALAYLLLRQVWRSSTVRAVLRVAFGHSAPAGRETAATRRHAVAPRLGRQWAQLAHDAEIAGRRFHSAMANLADGPLRAALADAAAEVDEAVVEARRLAWQGDRTQRAHREVLTALATQRRRARRGPAAGDELERSLDAATRAQQSSAQRLAAATGRDLRQLQLVVARLHELTAHTLELATLASAPQQLSATTSIADRVAALRMATEEVETMAAV